MSIVCWTVFYPGGPSITHGVTRLAHAAGRHVRPIVHRANLMQHHVAKITAQPHRWFKLVCKVIPAAIAGGGVLLAPHPTMPTYLPAQPPAFVAPGPMVAPVPAPISSFWPPTSYTGPWPPTISAGVPPTAVPEPGSAAVLMTGVAGLLLIRLSMQRLP